MPLIRPGYIAGVVNPMFGERTEWWDVLCDVSTGKITLNPNTMPQEKEKLAHSKSDAEFFQRVQFPTLMAGVLEFSILNVAFIGQVSGAVNSHYGEDHVKRLFEVSAHFLSA